MSKTSARKPPPSSVPMVPAVQEAVIETAHLRLTRAFQKLSVLHAGLTEPEQSYAYREGMEQLVVEILEDLHWLNELPEAILTIPCPDGDDVTAIGLGDTVCLVGVKGVKGHMANADARQYIPREADQ